MAQWLGAEYWHYVVNKATTTPQLYAIKDPTARLRPEEVVKVVRYVIRDRKAAATS